ncbi:reverse transcriptase domain-containing protein [Tanacetum coccineum]
MLKRCEDTNFVLNWEKCHFMVKEGIVLGHKISKSEIEVDRAKVDVIAKPPHPTSVKGSGESRGKNLAADHLSRQENPHEGDLEKKEINENFPLETLGMISSHNDSSDVFTAKKPLISSRLAIMDPPGDIMVPTTPLKKSLLPVSFGLLFTKMPMTWSHGVTLVNVKAKSRNVIKCLKMLFKFARSLTCGSSILWDHSRLHEGTSTFSWPDCGTYFCNDQFAKVMLKYGVTHRLSTTYHPQTSGQVDVSNRGLKRILERTVGENRASWSDKLDDELWAFCTAFKTPIGCTSYKLVYGKAYHLPIELEHKANWALKHCNFDLKTVGDHQKVQMNELNELRDQAYENSLIYKEKTKKTHDSKIKNRVFNVGDRVLLFNSRLKIFLGKLKTRWTGPFTVAQVFPYGTAELSQTDGPNFKDCPDFEDSRAHDLVHRLLDLQSFTCIFMGIRYPRSY